MESFLKVLIKFYGAQCYKQNTIEWLNNRVNSIGCSELRKAVNTLNNKALIVKTKIDIENNNLDHVDAIVWGKIFENSVKRVTEIILNCDINDAPGSIKNTNKYVTCSPDGLGVLPIKAKIAKKMIKGINVSELGISRGEFLFSTIIDQSSATEIIKMNSEIEKTIDKGYTIVDFLPKMYALFEFKAPITRKLERNKIPPEYIYQVLGGLNVINFCSMGVFSECKFKLCKPDQFGFNPSFIPATNNDEKQSQYTNTKITVIGIKIIVNKDPTFEQEANKQLLHSVYDMKQLINTIFIENMEIVDLPIFKDYKNRNLTSLNHFIDSASNIVDDFQINTDLFWGFLNGENEITEFIDNLFENKQIVACCLWKLVDCNVMFVKKVNDFLKFLEPDLRDVTESIKLINENIAKDDQLNFVNSLKFKNKSKGKILLHVNDMINNKI